MIWSLWNFSDVFLSATELCICNVLLLRMQKRARLLGYLPRTGQKQSWLLHLLTLSLRTSTALVIFSLWNTEKGVFWNELDIPRHLLTLLCWLDYLLLLSFVRLWMMQMVPWLAYQSCVSLQKGRIWRLYLLLTWLGEFELQKLQLLMLDMLLLRQ